LCKTIDLVAKVLKLITQGGLPSKNLKIYEKTTRRGVPHISGNFHGGG
jgi:hypothetical protein